MMLYAPDSMAFRLAEHVFGEHSVAFRVAEAAFKLIFEGKYVTSEEVAKMANVSSKTATTYLSRLVRRKVLANKRQRLPDGRIRVVYYLSPDFILTCVHVIGYFQKVLSQGVEIE